MSAIQTSRNINERLDAFRAEMFAKFKRVEHKHRGTSVTDDQVDWMTFNWPGIEAHLIDEFAELFNLTEEENSKLFSLLGSREDRSSPKDEKEAVDLANMAFLIWWKLVQK